MCWAQGSNPKEQLRGCRVCSGWVLCLSWQAALASDALQGLDAWCEAGRAAIWAQDPIPNLSISAAAMFRSNLLQSYRRTGRLDESFLVWLNRSFRVLLAYCGATAVTRLCGLSYRVNQFVNMKGGAMYKRRIPWVSRLKPITGMQPNEIHENPKKRRRPARQQPDFLTRG